MTAKVGTITRKDLGLYVSPMGTTVWTLPGGDLGIMWSPGGGLLVGQPLIPNGYVTKIEHPTADGRYATRAEAQRAVLAFLNAVPAR